MTKAETAKLRALLVVIACCGSILGVMSFGDSISKRDRRIEKLEREISGLVVPASALSAGDFDPPSSPRGPDALEGPYADASLTIDFLVKRGFTINGTRMSDDSFSIDAVAPGKPSLASLIYDIIGQELPVGLKSINFKVESMGGVTFSMEAARAE